jgi:SAM-dependent methyltransferase
MMFGTRERFEYFECAGCGSLNLVSPPADLARYYPARYYSLQRADPARVASASRIARRLILSVSLRQGRSSEVIERILPPPEWVTWLRGLVTLSSSILDFGCGSGDVLLSMRKNGFSQVTGFEPHLPEAIDYRNGVVVHNTLESIRSRRFDLVLVNHVFEHLQDPHAALEDLIDLLADDGSIVLRMPFADSSAWRTYRGNWVQLDPPRHVVIQTRASVDILCEKHGLEVVRELRDGTGFQFAGSEQYVRDIPLRDPRRNSLFSNDEVTEFERRARELNATGDGDQGLVVLQRSTA